MKHKYSIAMALCSLYLLPSANAQWTDVINSNVNFEFKVTESWYGGSNDFDGQADPTIITDLYLNGGWFGELCTTWDCSASCSSTSGNWVWYAGTGSAMDANFSLWIRGFESDNSNECVYTSGDDHHWSGLGLLRDNQTAIPLVYPSTDFRPCNWNGWLAANGSQWCFQNATDWDQRWAQTWRYSAGDQSTDPLDFGTITNGQTKSDINANRAVSVGSSAPLQYTNTDGQSSADVWYKFTVNEPTNITISTNHGETDFDTYLSLYTVSGSFVVADDDGGSNNSSVITTTICPGTYIVNTEGYSSNTGLFKISVSASSAGNPSLTSVNSTGVSCPGETDGTASWGGTGGVAPYTYEWSGSGVGTSTSGLAQGSYTLEITDACGSSSSQTVSIDVADVTPPNAQCQSLVEITVSQGNTTTLDPIIVDNGSTDNCGYITYSVSPSTFDIGDVGANNVTLTVTDESGNSSTCTANVYALNNTGIEEDQLTQNISIFPNPNVGTFSIDLSTAQIENDAQVIVLDAIGRTVLTQPIRSQITQMDLQNAESGIYLVRITNDGINATKRVTISKK